MNLFGGKEYKHRHREWTCGHGGEGEGGTNWEIGIDICSLPCIKQLASGDLPYSAGSSARCPEMTWRGGIVGREVQERGDICTLMADSLRCIAKTSTIL